MAWVIFLFWLLLTNMSHNWIEICSILLIRLSSFQLAWPIALISNFPASTLASSGEFISDSLTSFETCLDRVNILMFNVEVRTIINYTEPSDINRASICIRVQRKVQKIFFSIQMPRGEKYAHENYWRGVKQLFLSHQLSFEVELELAVVACIIRKSLVACFPLRRKRT